MKTTGWWIYPLAVVGVAVALFVVYQTTAQPQPAPWSYSELVRHAQAGEVKDVTISGAAGSPPTARARGTTCRCPTRPPRSRAT